MLEEVNLSPAELESIDNEIQDNELIVAELEEFSQTAPWISLQTQPTGKMA
jgi:hypothetical protein